MVVNTQYEPARRLATTIFELIMASHPLDCANCERNGTCQLQRVAAHLKVNLNTKRFRKVFRGAEIDDSHPRITYDANKCILCGRCVYFCRERQGESALGFAHRGFKRRVSTFTGEPLGTYACSKCDACARVCPVGALMLKK
jgi:formate dehydrogenase major subunit/NADH-quinone oxidoreductase subunit G